MEVKPWKEWSDEIAASVRAVPDGLLIEVARTLLSADIVITAGNGGSASLASHAAQALMKPDYAPGGGLPAVCLNDTVPTLTAHANDGGWEQAFLEAARPFMWSSAVFWLFSSSGKSPNIARLAARAVSRARAVISFTGFEGEPLRSFSSLSVHVHSHDYEVVEPVHDALLHRVQHHVRALSKERQ